MPIIYIYRQLEASGSPVWFYDFIDGDHTLSSIPMFDNLNEIETFLDKFVERRLNLRIHTVEHAVPSKDFAHFLELYGTEAGWMFLSTE